MKESTLKDLESARDEFERFASAFNFSASRATGEMDQVALKIAIQSVRAEILKWHRTLL